MCRRTDYLSAFALRIRVARDRYMRFWCNASLSQSWVEMFQLGWFHDMIDKFLFDSSVHDGKVQDKIFSRFSRCAIVDVRISAEIMLPISVW
jgi:hypothetical protein